MAKKSKSSRSKSAAKSAPKSKSARHPARNVYYFGDGKADGAGNMKPLLGGKGANLAEMTRIGLPVPPGFTITTEVCTYFSENKRTYPAELEAEVEAALAKVEKSVGKKLGDKERPLLVSVRSGARDSMPGHDGHHPQPRDERHRGRDRGRQDRAIRVSPGIRIAVSCKCTATSCMGVQKRAGEDHEPFESVIEHLKDERYGNHNFPDVKLTVDDLKELVRRFKDLIKERTGKSFPQDPRDAALGRDRRRLRFLEQRPRSRLSPQVRHSRTTGARRSTCRRWSSATWATRARPASPSPAIRPAARKFSTANI